MSENHRLLNAAAEIQAAETAVETARSAYSKGSGTVAAVNKADRRLADAHCRYREVSGGIVHDRR